MRFLDANVILRYLTRDDPVKAASCLALFERAQAGEEEITTCEVIVHEVLYVLCSRAHYGLSRTEAVARLQPIILLRGLRLAHKRRYQRALDLFASNSNFDFGDALAVAHMEAEGIEELYSYDTDFDAVATVKRVQP